MLAALSLLLLALCGSTQAGLVLSGGVSFEANANVTLASPDSRFNYRQVSFTQVPLFNVLIYNSIQASGQSSGNTASANVNGIFGVAYFNGGLVFAPPTAYMCFYNASASFAGLGGSGAFSADISASLAMVGKVYDKIEEIDANGNVVATINLASFSYGLNGGIKTVDATKGLYYATITATSNGATIAITFTVSGVLGKLSNGGATITPTSMETFFEVDNYVYANTANHLRLTIYFGHLSADASVSGSATVVAGSGTEQVYIRLDGTAIVNGNTESVTVSGLAQNNVDVSNVPSTYLRGQLVGHGSLKAEVRKITVDFPAGATSLTYDPTVGFGAPNSGSFLAPSFFLMVLVAAIFMVMNS